MKRQRGIADGWLIAIGIFVLIALCTGAMVYHTRSLEQADTRGYNRGKGEVQLKFDKFVGDTRLAGTKSEAARVAKEAQDKFTKEKNDAENQNLKLRLATTVGELRRARASTGTRSGVLPSPAPGASSADTVTFRRADLDTALGAFVEGAEGLVAEGAGAVIDLDGAKKWARELGAVK